MEDHSRAGKSRCAFDFPPTQEPFTGDGLRRNRGISTQHWNLEQQFEQAFMEWLNEENLYPPNTLGCWSPARAPMLGLSHWDEWRESNLAVWKTTDHIGKPQAWRASCTILRHLGSQLVTDHWTVQAPVQVQKGRKRWWTKTAGPILKGLKAKSMEDEDSFCRTVMSKIDLRMDVTADISMESISELLSQAAQAMSYDEAGGQQWVVKSREHFEAARASRGKLL